MTDEQIAALRPAFAAELRRYRDGFGRDRTARHFDTSRKSAEPIALAAGTAVRTLPEFLVTAAWDHLGGGTGCSGGWPTPWPNGRPTRSAWRA